MKTAKLKSFLSWLFFPPICPSCGRSLDLEEVFCPVCLRQLERPTPGEVCPRCGKPICICGDLHPVFTRTFPAAYYSEVMTQAIQQMKFYQNPGHARTLAPLLVRTLAEFGASAQEFDLIAAAPVSKKRMLQRGYNQAALLAAEVSKHTGIPFEKNALYKIRETKSQHDLSAEERQNNLKDCFRGDPLVKGKHILLCDDVLTTGSTANEAAIALLTAGAKQVDVLVLSITRPYEN